MYVFIDTETGGLTPDYSLLTLAAAVTDEDFNIRDIVCFGIHGPTYCVTKEAMEVNQINLVDHAKSALSSTAAAARLREFLINGAALTGRKKLIPAGHNVAFDLRFIHAQLIDEVSWNEYCTYPALDTVAIARFFVAAKRITGSCSLPAMRKLFQIETGSAHNAESDMLASIELAKKFVQMANQGVPTP